MISAVEAMVERELRGKRILIWGAGREGLSTFLFLRRHLPEQAVWIAGEASKPDRFEGATFLSSTSWTEEYHQFDLIFKSPGIPILDKKIHREALTSQTELFFRCFRDQIIGITGTKGKSTTASLLYHILSQTRGNTVFVGNIGIPCLDLIDQITPETLVVFELSCHQLECVTRSPHIGVILNLYEDHLDHYGTYQNYVSAKENIFRFQQKGDILILNKRDQAQIAKAPHALTASMDEDADICLQGESGNILQTPQGQLSLRSEDTRLPGRHNRYNIAVVYAICRLLGVEDRYFLQQLATFRGLPHRLEYVATVNGVDYYDDSISTICETTQQALECLPHVGTLLLGGMDRGIDYSGLADYLVQSRVEHLVLMPDTHDRIHTLLLERGCRQQIHLVSGLEEAVQTAKRYTAPGSACLLSPAAASYGFFENFEKRGEAFQQLVRGD